MREANTESQIGYRIKYGRPAAGDCQAGTRRVADCQGTLSTVLR